MSSLPLFPALTLTLTPTPHAPALPAVVPQRRPDSEAGVSLRDQRQLVLSYPAVGKHFAFDGRFLHGVPPPSLMGNGERAAEAAEVSQP